MADDQKDPKLGRYKSAESKARGQSGLRGNIYGESRQTHMRDLPSVEALYQQEYAKLIARKPGEPSSLEKDIAEGLADAKWLRLRSHSWLKTYPRSTSAQADRHHKRATDLILRIADLSFRLDQATQQRIAEAQRPNQGLPVYPKRDPLHSLLTLLILCRSGALPYSAPGIREAAGVLIDLIEAAQADEKPRLAEIDGLTTQSPEENR